MELKLHTTDNHCIDQSIIRKVKLSIQMTINGFVGQQESNYLFNKNSIGIFNRLFHDFSLWSAPSNF